MGDPVVEVAKRLAEQPRHLFDPGVGRARHDLGLADQVPRVADDPVDAAREGEGVLGLERCDERLAQSVQEVPLGRIASNLRVSHALRGPRIPARPCGKGIDSVCRHLHLVPQNAYDVRGLRQEPAPTHQAINCQSP